MLKEFKEFAFKGNLVDMAVGFILGGAFATVVQSLVDNVIMPPLGLLLGGVDFRDMKYVIKEGAVPEEAAAPAAEGAEDVAAIDFSAVEGAEVAIRYGETISDFIAFTMLAFVVFIIVKKVMKGKEEAEEPPAQEVLLTEIRDLLKK